MSGYFWLFTWMSGYFWLYTRMSGYLCWPECRDISGYMSTRTWMSGYFWLYTWMSGNFWLYTWMLGYFWLYVYLNVRIFLIRVYTWMSEYFWLYTVPECRNISDSTVHLNVRIFLILYLNVRIFLILYLNVGIFLHDSPGPKVQHLQGSHGVHCMNQQPSAARVNGEPADGVRHSILPFQTPLPCPRNLAIIPCGYLLAGYCTK